MASVDDEWEAGAHLAWLIDRERARWAGADLALDVGTDPHVSLSGPAVPAGRRPGSSSDRQRARSDSPVRSWILDSGSAFDIVSRGVLANSESSSITSGPRRTLQTANGDLDASDEARVEVHQLGHVTDAVVLEESPCVLSLGKLIEAGHAFHWPKGSDPYLILPDGTHESLDVVDGVPQLRMRSRRSPSVPAVSDSGDEEASEDPEDPGPHEDVLVGSRIDDFFDACEDEVPTREPPPWPPGAPRPPGRAVPVGDAGGLAARGGGSAPPLPRKRTQEGSGAAQFGAPSLSLPHGQRL